MRKHDATKCRMANIEVWEEGKRKYKNNFVSQKLDFNVNIKY